MAKGLEPDECYYGQHEAAVRDDNESDLSIAPPPDLVIEVDITYRALGREPIYAAPGVPELWRFDGERIEFLALAADRSYQPLPRSLAFPMLDLSDLQRFVQMFRDGDKDDTSILRAFREWVKETLSRGQGWAFPDRRQRFVSRRPSSAASAGPEGGATLSPEEGRSS